MENLSNKMLILSKNMPNQAKKYIDLLYRNYVMQFFV